MHDERRKELRFPVNQSGELRLVSGKALRVKVTDISASGVGMICDEGVARGAGADLHLLLLVPVQRWFIASLSVCSVTLIGFQGYRLGASFAGLAPDMQEALLAYIKTRGRPVLTQS